jgi:PadR family transcriptional regulator PadR
LKDLTKTEEILLLSIWRLKDQAYGLKIRRHVIDIIGKDFTYGNLYSSLDQLTKKKYVMKHPGETTPARRGKKRMYYTLTEAGRLALKKAYETNLKLWSGVPKYVFESKNK